jgi:perosamine synthetase
VMKKTDMDEKEEIPFYIPLIEQQDKRAVLEALSSRWLTGGPKAVEFEKEFAKYVGTRFAVSVNSCTAALHLAMRVLNIRSGDEVIVPDLTFAATANAPLFCGAKPVFADIDEKTFNISPADVQRKISDKTKAIIPMHYGGQPCDMKEIGEIAEDKKLFVVEDCAHSLGADYEDLRTGTFGAIGCFSFYPTKIITTLEGGMLTTNDEKIDRRARLLREHGMDRPALQREVNANWRYDVIDLGYNYRLPEPLAALGITQLNRIAEGIKRRIRLAKYYDELLRSSHFELVTPYVAKNRSHIFHLYTIRIKQNRLGITRDKIFSRLLASKIQSSVHYTPLHLMSFYKQFLNGRSSFPVAERIYREILSLPIFPAMPRKSVERVVTEIKHAFE